MIELPPIEEQMATFNIPVNLKHDHSDETLAKMFEGLAKLDLFLTGGHDKCVKQVVLFCEMNVKFLFIQSLISKGDKENVSKSFEIFIKNLMEIFIRKPL